MLFTVPSPETVACIGVCLKAVAIDCARASANEASTVTLPPTIGATAPPACTAGVEEDEPTPLPSAKSSLFDFTKEIPRSVLTSSICSTNNLPPGIRLKKSVITGGSASNSSSN